MATITPTLTLSSTDALTDALSITTTDDLTVTNPSEFSRKVVATGSAQTVIASNSSFSYVYLKVVSGANSTDWAQVLLGGHAKTIIIIGIWVHTSRNHINTRTIISISQRIKVESNTIHATINKRNTTKILCISGWIVVKHTRISTTVNKRNARIIVNIS